MTRGMPMTPAQREQRNAGPTLSGWEIARAVVRCLYFRLGPWLDEVARQMGEADTRVKRPKAVVIRDDVSDATKGQFPNVVVDFRAMQPRQNGDGEFNGTFAVEVIASTDDTDLGQALKLMGIYATAIQACLTTTLHEYAGGLVFDVAPGPHAVDKRDQSGAVADVLMQVQAGPLFSRFGYLEPPDPEEPGPDNQGDQNPITNVDLTYEAHPAGGGAHDGTT